MAEKSGLDVNTVEELILNLGLAYREWIGIIEEKTKEWYEILEIDPDAITQDELKLAYRNLAKKYHPDINKSPEALTMMQIINNAYEKGVKVKNFE